jgi:dihydrofolate synthase/folylpolyglutamate synthase
MSFDIHSYLDSFMNWEPRLEKAGVSSFSLDRVEKLLHAFGRPDDKLKFLHVAGSKGKGSTCAFLASILRAAGYRVGLYTSPHLYDVRERIRVLEPEKQKAGSGKQKEPGHLFEGMISSDDMADRARFYQTPVEDLRRSGVEVTYFEYLTVLAMSYFAAKKVEIVVLETGLGGRLDATNVVDTMVCGLTPIGLEHTKILGDTLARIAAEKAGIIKSPDQKVVVAPQSDEALAVIEERCRVFGIRPSVIGRDVSPVIRSQGIEGVVFDIDGRRQYRGLSTRLVGAHQVTNASMAIAMAEDLEMSGFLLTEDVVARGISGADWPVRFEIVRREPFVILDCAHTRESAAAFVATFHAIFPGRKATLIFGASSDKDIDALAKELCPVAERVVLAKADHPRAADLSEEEGRRLFNGVDVVRSRSVRDAVAGAVKNAKKDDIIVVVGSIFLAAEAREAV